MKRLFILIFAGLALCTGFCSCSKNKDTKSLHIDINKGYSIVFPENWPAQKQSEKITIALNRKEFGEVSMNIVAQDLVLPDEIKNTEISSDLIENVLGATIKDRVAQGVRKIDGEKAFWHILNIEAPQELGQLQMAIFQVVSYYDGMFYIISCNAAAETIDYAMDKLNYYKPTFLASIKTFKLLNKKKNQRRKILLILAALSSVILLSFLIRFLFAKNGIGVVISAILAAIFWGASFGVLFFLLGIKISFMSASPLFLISFYILSPYLSFNKKKR